ncbi:hypothetical protein [Sanyastnella coralliicola]|uniref:hypothetical protein n=1 Tax=Sanyastnella coralliicola TaxID=3069118 RepID=UPI0027B960EC|nr:hypothetical protein [Longitalea sp. SCSIO 12813]
MGLGLFNRNENGARFGEKIAEFFKNGSIEEKADGFLDKAQGKLNDFLGGLKGPEVQTNVKLNKNVFVFAGVVLVGVLLLMRSNKPRRRKRSLR